jgi:hypothetical protein
MIKIDFEFNTEHGIYRDALHLDDNHSFTEQEIEAMKQERVNNWINIVINPPIEVLEQPLEENPVTEVLEQPLEENIE